MTTKELIDRAELLQAIEDEADEVRLQAAQIVSVAHNGHEPGGDADGITNEELEQLLIVVRAAKASLMSVA